MDTTTLLIIIVVLLLLGGGWYGGTLVLIFSPTIGQQSRLLSQRHDPPWPLLDCFLI